MIDGWLSWTRLSCILVKIVADKNNVHVFIRQELTQDKLDLSGRVSPASHWVKTTYLLRFMTFFSPPSQLGIQGKQPTGILITGSKPRMRITPSELTRQSCRDKLPGLFSSFLEFLFVFVHFLAWLASARLCCPNVSSITLVTDGIIRGRHLADRQPPKPNNKYELAAWPQGYRVESLLTRLTADEQKLLVAIRHLINGG